MSDGEGRGARRDVLNQARRRVERVLATEDLAEELAAAAEAALSAGVADAARAAALQQALDRYRSARGR